MRVSKYAFTQRAPIVGILLATIIPCIGLVIVCKRLPMIGDALSHTSLAEVAAGLLLGLDPVLAAAAACVVAVIGIEAICRKIPRFSEISIATIVSTGTGLAGILSEFIKNAASSGSFLFGSIMAIGNGELYLVIAASMVVLLTFLFMYEELLYVSLNEQSTRLVGVLVKTVNLLSTALIAVTISIAVRMAGTPIVSSIMVVPVACAVQFGTGYRQTLILTVVLDILFMTASLFAAYYLELKLGGTIVLVGVLVLILALVEGRILR